MTMKARTCNGVGTVLWHLKKPLVGLAWHQKDLKYSAVAGDVEGMQRALRNLELLSAATKNSTSAGVTLVLLQVWAFCLTQTASPPGTAGKHRPAPGLNTSVLVDYWPMAVGMVVGHRRCSADFLVRFETIGDHEDDSQTR